MSRLVEFRTADGSEIVVEVATDEPQSGEVTVSTSGAVVEHATRTLEESLQQIRPLTDVLIGRLSDLVQRPDEFTLEFGLKLSSQAGIVVAKAAVEGQITVKLHWKNSAGV